MASPQGIRKRSKWEDNPPQPPSKRRQIRDDVCDSSKRPASSIFAPPRTYHPPLTSSRSVYSYERLNSIEEGSYGVVFRAREKQTGDIVALKKLKLDEEKHGFPITALREINALMACRHDNVVNIREVVVGETLTQYAL
jgi:cell division cycle 2-like protein